MTELRITSVPMMELLQEACEALVISKTVLLPHECNVKTRAEIIEKRREAIKMGEHIRDLIKNNNSDSHNTKS